MAEARKTVTVVFADLAGSTGLGEALDPETLRGIMERNFADARAAIERHGGTLEKFIGDAVMAVFGIPAVQEDDALRAVRAVWEMRERLAALNVELERERGFALGLRTGVNTGEVVARKTSSSTSAPRRASPSFRRQRPIDSRDRPSRGCQSVSARLRGSCPLRRAAQIPQQSASRGYPSTAASNLDCSGKRAKPQETQKGTTLRGHARFRRRSRRAPRGSSPARF